MASKPPGALAGRNLFEKLDIIVFFAGEGGGRTGDSDGNPEPLAIAAGMWYPSTIRERAVFRGFRAPASLHPTSPVTFWARAEAWGFLSPAD